MKKTGKQKLRLARVFLYLFAFFSVVFILYPYFVMLVSSLKGMDEIFRIPGTIFPEKWVWTNYVDIWRDIPLAVYFKNSAIIAVGATALCIACAIPAGYALARMQFPGKRFVMSCIVVTQMFSAVVLLVGIYKLMVSLHLQNTRTGLILLIAAFNQAFAAWLLSGTFATISKELEEAAMIDGCSRVRALIRVILPLAAPGIVTAIVFVFINAWNEYTLTLVLIGDPMLKSLNVGIHAFFGYTNTEWWYVFAASLLATLPILCFFQILERQLVGGLTAGGVKG
ncbi:MAG: carbohydrate ABC transporter permease [Lachnospiraceae bacterium]|nr:carbohydrate ABC transporter permease [Lachnospiraceae bacterium]